MMLKSGSIKHDEAMTSLKRIDELESEEERKERHRRFLEFLKIPSKDG